MKVVFPVMGAENISVGYLSAYLRRRGVETAVAFDRSLFDDKQYFPVYFLAKLFSDKRKIVKAIVEYKPDIVAFSCMLDNYRWCLDVAKAVKEKIDTHILFGGIHPTSVPDKVLRNDCVDFVCVSEGEKSLYELVRAIERGDKKYEIPNLYYKKDGNIVRNGLRPLMQQGELGSLPFPDKEIFENFVPIQEYYLTVSLKGCICDCSYCSQNFYKKWEDAERLGKPFIREKSASRLLEELSHMKRRYNIKYVDIKNNVLSGSREWAAEFLERYPREIGVPFRIMGHPKMMTDDYCRKLKDAGCCHVQLGIESMNPEVRRKVLRRYESNDDIVQSIEMMERYGLRYSVDVIVGLPGEKQDDILEAIRLMSGRSGLVRASIFWLSYLPRVAITEYALEKGYITKDDVERMEEGLQENYLSTGSVMEKDRQKYLKNFHIIFRILPITPKWFVGLILKSNIYKYIYILPNFILTSLIVTIDVIVSILKRDYYAIFMMRWVLRGMMLRLFRREKVFSLGKALNT